MNNYSKLDDGLGLPTTIDHDEPKLPAKVIESTDKDVDNDYQHVRSSLQLLGMKGQEALDGALEVATESEHPRAYEVVGGLIKTLSDNNARIMDLHKQVKEIKHKEAAPGQQDVTNNNLVISTTDLQKMLAKG